ncbi:MAG TPA: discoidin domain-containing protein [Verrucomicrobiae bacterium]|nr:discoidin domain-containing protein [Verrucomicrobiae bacterium]
MGTFVAGALQQQRARLVRTLVAAVALATGSCGTVMAAKLPVASVTASANDGNVPENTLDGSLTTRWSASGDGQWIRFDLGAAATVGTVKIAWYQGNQRTTSFDIQTSDNASSWSTVFTGASSGATTGLESYDVADSVRRYVRIVGHGNSQNLWNSITEVELYAGSETPPSTNRLRISTAKVSNSQRVTLQWNGLTGAVSQVQAGVRAGTWANLGSLITNVGGLQTWQEVVASSAPMKFYRVQQTPITNTPPLPPIGKVYATVQMGSKKMACYINRPVDQYDPRVTRAVIVIHGAGANASAYFDRIDDVVPSSWGDKVMVIAPYFQGAAPSGEWGWPDDDWREAGASGGISSFTVLDNFVELLRNGNFPNLKWVVVTGHSAGGQTTQRFASFTDVDARPWPNAQYMKFVVANPSSYVYLNQYRNPEGDSTWVIPAQDCSSGDGYNEWKYGLDNLYGYTAARGAQWARVHLPARQVELLAGTADTYDNGDLDLNCGAEWQGPFRYQRAHIFKMFMDRYYPANHLRITDVPGVDHDSTRMFASPQGMSALFFAD